MQPSLFNETLTVSQLTFRIRKLLEETPELQDVWVVGEISNLSRPASGHIYFTLKDKNASLRCVMWKTDVARNHPSLQEGAGIEVHGKIAVYEPQGQYQLIANLIRPKGEGALFQEFLRLKARLETEGLFNPERKRPIPELPQKIGIVTSATGAALRDILNILSRRLPLAEVILAPSPVQGVDAPPALVQALESLGLRSPDVIILARGGGSIEDLWAFNDERVVRTVAASQIPIICGVGHETDLTLCDFAADLRAPTPTAAAELATQLTIDDLRFQLSSLQTRITDMTFSLLADHQATVATVAERLKYVSPYRRIQSAIQQVDHSSRRLNTFMGFYLGREMTRLNGISKRLEALNPQGILARGYAIITRKDSGKVVAKVSDAHGEMKVRVSNGEFEVTRKP